MCMLKLPRIKITVIMDKMTLSKDQNSQYKRVSGKKMTTNMRTNGREKLSESGNEEQENHLPSPGVWGGDY